MMQAGDATNREYQNPSPDISDEQIQLIAHFVNALPAPRHELPSDAFGVASVHRGKMLFDEVGCNVCHVPDMMPADGVYSDFLLHDMGRESIDLNHAEPYIVHRALVKNEVEVDSTPAEEVPVSYDGLATSVPMISENSGVPSSTRPAFSFRALQSPKSLISFRVINSNLNLDTWNNTVSNRKFIRNNEATQPVVKTQLRERMQIQPTNFNQEWRTAPLWGIHDSAPYWHDGRAETILEAIAMHDGEAAGTRDRFLTLSYEDRQSVVDFLDSLVAP